MNSGDRDARRHGLRSLLPAFLGVLLLSACSSSGPQPLAAEVPSVTASAAFGLATPASPSPTSTPEPSAPVTPDATPDPLASVLAAVAPPQGAPNVALYRIEIPSLGINLPIAEGDVQRDVERSQTPEHYAFHLPGTSMFGPGNTYIYAHARVGMFLSLWNVKLGDLVVVRTPNGPREYLVEEIHPRVPPTDVSWAGPTQDTRLTLQTSTGPYGTDPRFVVVARPR